MKNIVEQLEDYFCSAILLGMTILTCINVFARYIFKSSMPFVEELTSLGLVIISLAGAAVAAKRGAHLGLTLLTDFLSEKVQKSLIMEHRWRYRNTIWDRQLPGCNGRNGCLVCLFLSVVQY